MIGALAVLAVVVLVVWRMIRRRRVKDTRAGLVAAHPVFMVDPPRRRLSPRGRESL